MAEHYSVPCGFPPFALGFVDEETLVLGGGGGSSKSGVKNQIMVARLKEKQLEKVASLAMDTDEDAPMSLAVHSPTGMIAYGANQAPRYMTRGENDNLRLASFDSGHLKAGLAAQGLDSADESNYQRAAVISPDGQLLAVGNTDGSLCVFTFPSLQPTSLKHSFVDDEVYDLDFSPDSAKLVATSLNKVQIWSVAEKDLVSPSPRILQIIDSPGSAYSFRSAKFGRGSTSDRLYTLLNSAAQSKNKNAPRRTYLSQWAASTCSLLRTRVVSKRPVTAMDISSDGSHLALGGSDLSVSVWSAHSLLPLRIVRAAHDFPSTTLRFAPSGRTVVSASADNTLRVVPVEKTWALDAGLWTALVILIFSLVMAWAMRAK